jgi:hypothetical protein
MAEPIITASEPVVVTLTGEWQSGSSQMHVTINFSAANLDEALVLVKRATDGAPLFKNPLEEGEI